VTGAEVAGDPLPSVMQALNETISQPLENRICRQTGRRWNVNAPDLMPRVAKSCRKSW
jgi:hypothetical protein